MVNFISNSRQRTFLFFLIFISIYMVGCAPRENLLPVHNKDFPLFQDDFTKESLQKALSHHIKHLQEINKDRDIIVGENRYSVTELYDSLILFQQLLEQFDNPTEFKLQIEKNFDIFKASGRSNFPLGEMLVTGYYEPLLEGSLQYQPPFIYPLYSQPISLLLQKDPSTGALIKGRLDDNGTFTPYWTRSEIELEGHAKGYEIVYLKDPFEAFILHVQGSGKIKLRDGSLRSIHYMSDNGREYNSIGKLLVDQEKLKLEDVTIPTIHKYLLEHPDEQESIFHHNTKFIFFKWEDDGGPYGSLGKPLTAGRSIAIDSKTLPTNLLGLLSTRQPVINSKGEISDWKKFHRFVLPQDTGSAIHGPGRVDIFWGNGIEAEISAGAMKEKGELYFLIKKLK